MATTTAAPEFTSLREKIAWEKQERLARYARFEEIFAEAVKAGQAAHDAATPRPIIVGTPTTPLGDDIDLSKPVDYVSEGVCGFAWVRIAPATSSFARWLVKQGHGSTSYKGGIQVWVRTQTQSYERKMAYAQAMADVLTSAPELSGQRIYAAGRLD